MTIHQSGSERLVNVRGRSKAHVLMVGIAVLFGWMPLGAKVSPDEFRAYLAMHPTPESFHEPINPIIDLVSKMKSAEDLPKDRRGIRRHDGTSPKAQRID